MSDGGCFKGFGPEAMAFFQGLAAENNRDWFQAHKAEYERGVKGPAMDLVADLNTAFAEHDVPLHGEPKRALFRISRDVRFARDKSPYKTNVSAVLTRSGDKHDQGLFYVQHGLDGAFAAVGFYALQAPELAAFRARIVSRSKDWRSVVGALAEETLALSREPAAVRLPRGFKAEEVGDLAEDLKLKSYTVSRPLTANDLASPSLPQDLAAFAHSALPLLEFGWRALAAAA